MKKHKILKRILISLGVIIGVIVLFVGGALVFATVTTLKVEDTEAMEVKGQASAKIETDKEINILTWNTGYGALDERQDCYWDGGKGSIGESEEVVRENLDAMINKIKEVDPDVIFLQELDLDSKRSYFVDELKLFSEAFPEDKYDNSYACNFKAGYIPIPLSDMTGRVEAGIAVFSKYDVEEATRIQLPIPFSWPMKLFNLKRCLLINRLPIEGSDKELVLINLHLEAYDDGEGKAKQLAMLMDIMKEETKKGNYVIAGGDFNQTFSTTNYEKYPKRDDYVCPVVDASLYPDFSFVMDDTYPTCRSLIRAYVGEDKETFPYYMIDGFVVSNNVEIQKLETINLEFKNTDHNPVNLVVTLKG